ncbi:MULTISPECIES: (Na+)-NQR maturation NqrM [Rheinheimera]|uniref:(Na+)-NQR maturation NqrM n=1 Tax=Rheinheimera TaxID=67575 RepID=UPI001E5A86E8|nr:(Na+)-NQR maturation NqrM [Rheinheimera faecalis]
MFNASKFDEVAMEVFIFTFIILIVVVAAMAIGYMVQRKTIAGSCGGLGALGIEKACDCDTPCEKRQQRMKKEQEWQQNKII